MNLNCLIIDEVFIKLVNSSIASVIGPSLNWLPTKVFLSKPFFNNLIEFLNKKTTQNSRYSLPYVLRNSNLLH
jgi:hypothetical protein